MIESGSSFGGYTIERLLGSGGMGVVYEASQSSLGRRVALKVLKPELAADPLFIDRFRREGRLQATIEHPHVLPVYEVGEADGHGLFIAMGLVKGPTLADLLKAGELGVPRTIALLEQVGDALDAANAAGLVHRDVKPQNVLVGEDDRAFLADFGLSRIGTDSASRSRPTVGTVAYVAPEVVGGAVPGPASDRYAFAATLFHCLTGDVVFPRGSEAAVLFAHTSEPPPRISDRRPELPAALDQVFEEALAKDPGRRPASARGLVAAVRERLEAAGVADLGAPNPDSRTGLTPETLPPGGRQGERSTGGGRRIALLAGVAVAAAAIGAGAVELTDDDDGTTAAATDAPVPELARNAQALGSSLEAPDRTVTCEKGDDPATGSRPCALAQDDLPGANLVVPEDGTIVGWAVRGASGEVALDIIRPRGPDTLRVGRSQWESAGNEAPFRFDANLAVERGDLIAVELGPGGSIGARDVEGATTQGWTEPFGGSYGKPDGEPEVDTELLLRADFVPGEKPEEPESLTGGEAATARDGKVIEQIDLEITRPKERAPVSLVEVDGRVALDLFRDGRRVQRVYIPDLVPGGEPISLNKYIYPDSPYSEIDVFWVNPSSGRMIFHFFNVYVDRLDFVL